MPQLFENAFTHAAIGMALVDLDGRWLRANRSFCQLVGYTEAELLALRFQDITHPDDLDADLASVAQLLRGEIESYQMEKRYRCKDGRLVWVLLSVSLARSESDGAPLHFISQIQDITARKEAEQDRDILFKLPMLFFAVYGDDGYFKRVSPQWVEALGYPYEELLTKLPADLIHPEDLARTEAKIRESLDGQLYQSFQNRLLRADGTYLWLVSCAVGVPERGLGFVVATDITPLKEAEARALADAREKQRLYDDLSAATAEIRSLQEGLVTICAWTKQVRSGENWVSLEEFLGKNLHLKLSHGMSDEVAGLMLGESLPPDKR